MPRYWIVCVQKIVLSDKGYQSSEGLPTFMLDSWIQGIEKESHAISTVRKILGEDTNTVKYSISVARSD